MKLVGMALANMVIVIPFGPLQLWALAGILLWSILHSVFVRPFILVGVLRNFMAAGVNDIPTEASFAALDSKSEKFRKLHAELA